jgi:hypothetical protein
LESLELARKVSKLGPAEAEMVRNARKRIEENPALVEVLPWYLVLYMQVRFAYAQGNCWESKPDDPDLAA